MTNLVIRMMLKGKVGQFVTIFQNLQLVSLYESASICVILIPEHFFSHFVTSRHFSEDLIAYHLLIII